MSKIIVDGVDYVPVKDANPGEQLRITSVDNRGLTFVGYINIHSPDRVLTIRDARCIIRWGTEKHIAELIKGPTKNTILGEVGDVEVFANQIIFSYRVNEEGWKGYGCPQDDYGDDCE